MSEKERERERLNFALAIQWTAPLSFGPALSNPKECARDLLDRRLLRLLRRRRRRSFASDGSSMRHCSSLAPHR